jgi:hypothetical protein
MIVFYILLNICFPYQNAIIPIYTKTNGFISTFCSVVSISSFINSFYGSMSKFCILDISSFGAGIKGGKNLIFSARQIGFKV